MVAVGVIGLGVVGSRVAKNFVKAGFQVVVYDVREDVLPEFKTLNAVVGGSPADVGSKSEFVFLTLPSANEVEDVLFGEKGVVKGLKAGGVVINLSTIGPKYAINFYRRLRDFGIEYVDGAVTAPYMGYLAAERGDLTIMVGCDEGVYGRVKELLSVLGRRVYRTGPVGTAQAVKLANNIMSAIAYLGVVEGALLAVKYGVDTDVLHEVISNGSGDSWALRNRLPRLASRNFEPGFKTKLMLKDVTLFLEHAGELGIFTPLTALLQQLLRAASLELAELDWGSIATIYEKFSGTEIRRKHST